MHHDDPCPENRDPKELLPIDSQEVNQVNSEPRSGDIDHEKKMAPPTFKHIYSGVIDTSLWKFLDILVTGPSIYNILSKGFLESKYTGSIPKDSA